MNTAARILFGAMMLLVVAAVWYFQFAHNSSLYGTDPFRTDALSRVFFHTSFVTVPLLLCGLSAIKIPAGNLPWMRSLLLVAVVTFELSHEPNFVSLLSVLAVIVLVVAICIGCAAGFPATVDSTKPTEDAS